MQQVEMESAHSTTHLHRPFSQEGEKTVSSYKWKQKQRYTSNITTTDKHSLQISEDCTLEHMHWLVKAPVHKDGIGLGFFLCPFFTKMESHNGGGYTSLQMQLCMLIMFLSFSIFSKTRSLWKRENVRATDILKSINAFLYVLRCVRLCKNQYDKTD